MEENGQTSGSSTKKKTRGMSKLKEIHARTDDERVTITLNAKGQPIGDRKVCGKFSRFLGTLARQRNMRLLPTPIGGKSLQNAKMKYGNMCRLAVITYTDWRKVPSKCKDEIWKYVQEKYKVPEDGKSWVMHTVGTSWKLFKCRLKNYYYKKYKTFEERVANRPKEIPEAHFVKFLKYTEELDDVKAICEKNKNNRLKHKFVHRICTTSYAIIRDELKQSSEDHEKPSDIDFFLLTRKPRKKAWDEETAKKLAELDELKKNGDQDACAAKFKEVMGHEHPGFVRFHGRGVTKTSLEQLVVRKRADEERDGALIMKMRAEHNENLKQKLHMTMTRLQQCNPTMTIPSDFFDFLLDTQANIPDTGSAQQQNPRSSAATNSPTG